MESAMFHRILRALALGGKWAMAAGVLLAQTASASSILIDGFSVAPPVGGLLTRSTPGITALFLPGADAIGDHRILRLIRPPLGLGSVSADVDVSFPETLTYMSDPMATGVAEVIWQDGGTLGGIDLTAAGADPYFAFMTASTLGGALALSVQSAGGVSTAFLSIPGDPAMTLIPRIVPFSSFTIILGSGADFSAVDRIRLLVAGSTAAGSIEVGSVGGSGIVVTSIAGTKVMVGPVSVVGTDPTIIPEPATIVLIGAGLAALGRWRFARR
jgi:hypothetical protein